MTNLSLDIILYTLRGLEYVGVASSLWYVLAHVRGESSLHPLAIALVWICRSLLVFMLIAALVIAQIVGDLRIFGLSQIETRHILLAPLTVMFCASFYAAWSVRKLS
jgi:hypothetical protein